MYISKNQILTLINKIQKKVIADCKWIKEMIDAECHVCFVMIVTFKEATV